MCNKALSMSFLLTIALGVFSAWWIDASSARGPKPKGSPPPNPMPPTGTVQNPTPPANESLPSNSSGFLTDTVEISPPPAKNPWAIPWAEAIIDTSRGQSGTVVMSYLRLYATINGVTQLVSDSTYTQVPMAGGYFVRSPWFGGNGVPISLWQLPPQLGGITVNLTNPNIIYHWWASNGRVNISGATDVWVQCQVMLTGAGAFDFGYDFWTAEDNGSVLEGASTRFYWAADCPTLKVLTIGK